MSQYIKTFNTRAEYDAWASGYTEGYAVSAYIIEENAIAGKEYTPFLQAYADETEFDYPATSTELHIKSNLNWTITKPSWVSMTTGGTCSADLTMEIAANDESKNSRTGNVVISYNQTSSETITLTQQGNPSYTGVPFNEIWYTSTDGNIETSFYYLVTIKDVNGNNLSVVSHTYEDGIGKLGINGDIDTIGMIWNYPSKVQSIQMPNSVTNIMVNAFSGFRNITSVTFSNKLTTISTNAFYGCSGLTSVDIPSGVTSIGENVFCNCTSLSSITIPTGITNIADGTFRNCSSLSSIDIPSGVTSIGDNAFLSCTSLSSIIIPSGVTFIGNYAFNSCTALNSITYGRSYPYTTTMSSFVFDNTNDCPIYVPAVGVSDYKAKYPWSSYASRIQAIPE